MLFWKAPKPASTIHGRFQVQAATRPRATALEWDGVRLTYGEVNAAANCLAHRLVEAKVDAECPVWISMQRSSDLVIAILAVLKAGGAYILEEHQQAGESLVSKLRASAARVAVTDAPRSFTALGVRVISGYVASGISPNPKHRAQADHWACEISGKMRTHEAVLKILDATAEEYGFRAGDGMFTAIELSGNAGMELLLPLMRGGRLVLASEDAMQDPVLLNQAIEAANCKIVRRRDAPAPGVQVARAAYA